MPLGIFYLSYKCYNDAVRWLVVEKILMGNYEFLKYNFGNANVIFSTAKGNLNFNMESDEGKENLGKLKKWFNLKEVGYLKQIHSNSVFVYDGALYQGDALITEKKDTAVGVFTADCVPILLYDNVKNIIAAVHSGWKGTILGITINTLNKMEQVYGCKCKNITAFIGPHNKECCYEIGNDVEDEFKKNKLFEDFQFMNGRNLNLEVCIAGQLEYKGVQKHNVYRSDICTFCNEDIQLYSYRKQKERCGRMFSFIYFT